MKDTVTVAVTGAGGQVAYSLLFRIANGEVFGMDTPVSLTLKEVPEFVSTLEGIKMELDDCAFPLLRNVTITDSDAEAFRGANWALLVGAAPRKPGQERKDLLTMNATSFIDQGAAINKTAAEDIRVVVVGNPCNTNCLIAMHHAPDVPRDRFSALTRLDQNRGMAQLAMKSGRPLTSVTNLAIWGNHSATQFPDFEHALIDGRPATEVIEDRQWLENQFVETVQKRGAAILAARGKSSAASAANAVLDHVRSAVNQTPGDEWVSAAILSDGNSYGVPEGLIYSFPVRSDGKGNYTMVEGLEISDYARGKLTVTAEELLSERADVSELL
ncbi:MAG: malate dehydrogenase [Chloroflexota bacterium]|nr:malate dehydrogenase [Chloroflexota bacterium]MDQ5866701.1 malate dehydrogenase [Chloroflexota bacterium]